MIDDISPPGSWVRELSARPHTYRDVWAALREAEARLAKVEAERDALRAAEAELRNIDRSSYSDTKKFPDYGDYIDWVKSRVRHTLAAIDAARGGA